MSKHVGNANKIHNFVNNMVSELWQFDSATLINVLNGTDTITNNVGVLILTTVDKETGKRQNGTVCKDMFNWRTAHLLCQSIGYVFADWGSYPTKYANK